MLPPLPATHSQLEFPELHPELEPYRYLLEVSVKPAWCLRCHRVRTISRTATHFGGITPYVPLDMGWPRCPTCGNVLDFIWQINFADFAAAAFAPAGLFQFFYCWACFPLPNFTPYEFEKLCRWYPDFNSNEAEAVPQALCPYLRELSSGQWEQNGPYRVDIIPFLSVPAPLSDENPLSQEMLKPQLPEGEDPYEVYEDLYEEYYEADGLDLTDCVSQVSGYPAWVQRTDETPHCPACGERAELVGAVGSHGTDYLWGDTGYWYIFACQRTDKCQGLNRPLMASQAM